jgi:hypothetical protein
MNELTGAAGVEQIAVSGSVLTMDLVAQLTVPPIPLARKF